MLKSIEIKNKIEDLKTVAQNFLDTGKVKEAQDKMEEIKLQKSALEMQEQLEKEENEILVKEIHKKPAPKKDSIHDFANAARAGFINGMSEGTNEDGGYTVPVDISTQIQTLRESADALEPYATVESVNTLSGARTFKKRAQQVGFSKVAEGGTIGAGTTPKFVRQDFTVEKYAGYFPVTSELLEDSDANIVSTLTQWIGNESRVTRNKLILEQIATLAKVDLKNLDGLKKAINVDLIAGFRASSKVYTNQDGLQYFDTLKDTDGNYLLQSMVTDATRHMIFGMELVVIGNDTLKSDVSVAKKRTIPVIIGDLKECIVLYDRKQLSIKSSTDALNAFENDLTLFRAIEREQVKIRDDKAAINGTITTTDETVVV